MSWNIFVLAVVSTIVVCQANCDMTLEKFKSEGIVHDVVDSVPEQKLTVLYGSSVIDFGNNMTPSATKNQPKVEFQPEEGALYTVLMVDPDAPSHRSPKFREWLHWLMINVPMNDLEKGKLVTEYRGPSPPKGSGPHRYVLLVFKQPGGKISESNFPDAISEAASSRKKFNTKLFAESLNLGAPIAGNFFYSEQK